MNIYPDKFVLFTSLKEHVEKNKKYIYDVAVVKVLEDNEASQILVRCKWNTFVYHTSKEKLEMDIVQIPILIGISR
ncbi:hypothetical protein FDA33_15105 [Clostridium botulinum]|nr:hypothetical protein [Clostridium botulinum]NFI18346.1 hypothetical protein [Clostridium botulinum]NFI54701.1 hypothetical protein [Clostridium botulinum]NFL93682.1 hypothetical protein [Clostridium botulinum]NFN20136.1 hypothetical protein [Clostridium botulinum]